VIERVIKELSAGQRAYEARRAAKAGMSLEKWLTRKTRAEKSCAASARPGGGAGAQAGVFRPPPGTRRTPALRRARRGGHYATRTRRGIRRGAMMPTPMPQKPLISSESTQGMSAKP